MKEGDLIPLGELNLAEFWKLRPNSSVAWTMRICELVRTHKLDGKEPLVITGYDNNGAIYYLNKKEFPAEEIGKMLGVEPTDLVDKPIMLPKLEKADDKMPAPTVPYWGMA